MADIKISQLPAGSTPLTGAELVPVVQSGNTYKVTTQDIADLSTAVPSLQDVLDYDHTLVDGQNYQGTLAGAENTGTNVNAIGGRAAKNNSGDNVNALGYQASLDNTGSGVNAMGQNAASNNTSNNLNAFGNDSASNNSGAQVNAIGYGAAFDNSGSNVNALGESSSESNSGDYVNGIGKNSAYNNSGDHVNGIGNGAGINNTGNNANFLGNGSGSSNVGDFVNALGNNSANTNSGLNVNAFGSQAAQNNTGNDVNAIGNNSALGNTGYSVNAFGSGAGNGNNYSYVNLFGENAIADNDNQTVFSKAGTISARVSYDTITSDRTYILPDNDGTIALTSDITSGTLQTVTDGAGNEITTNDLKSENNTSSTVAVRNTTNSVGAYLYQDATTSKVGIRNSAAGVSEIINTGVTGTRTYTLPNSSGTIALTSDITGGTLQSVTTAGNITTESMRSENASTSIVAVRNTVYNRGAYLYQDGTYSAVGIQNAGGGIVELKATNITGTKTPELPNSNYILAVSVNGIGASTAGNITLPVFTLQQVLDNNHDLTSGVNLQGTSAGLSSSGSNINALGQSSAQSNTGSNVNGLGNSSAQSNTGWYINAFGSSAGYTNTGNYVNALNQEAAYGNTGAHVNAFGRRAAKNNTGSYVNAFGNLSGEGNALSGMTIFSNDSLPTYADHAAASAAITVLLGASAGCTYLYHNQATDSIGAVRL